VAQQAERALRVTVVEHPPRYGVGGPRAELGVARFPCGFQRRAQVAVGRSGIAAVGRHARNRQGEHRRYRQQAPAQRSRVGAADQVGHVGELPGGGLAAEAAAALVVPRAEHARRVLLLELQPGPGTQRQGDLTIEHLGRFGVDPVHDCEHVCGGDLVPAR
jgi:hypothetical protein